MNNFRKAAPYLYLTKGSQEGTYVLFLLVPVGPSFDVNLNSVTPTGKSDHFEIAYSTTQAATTELYRLKNWILTKGTKQYVKVIADADAGLTMRIDFSAADIELATPAADGSQRQAPYIFLGKEAVGPTNFARPSCIVLFDAMVDKQTEIVSFEGESCYLNITCSTANVVGTSPTHFTINQNLRVKMASPTPYFEASVEQDTGIVSLGPGGGKKKRKVATHTPGALMANGNGQSNSLAGLEATSELTFRSGVPEEALSN